LVVEWEEGAVERDFAFAMRLPWFDGSLSRWASPRQAAKFAKTLNIWAFGRTAQRCNWVRGGYIPRNFEAPVAAGAAGDAAATRGTSCSFRPHMPRPPARSAATACWYLCCLSS